MTCMSVDVNDADLRQAAQSTNLLSTLIGEWAERKGFREDFEMARELELVADTLRDLKHISPERHERFHEIASVLRNNVAGTKLMLIVSELAEAMESLRDTGVDNIANGGNFGEELADAEIRIKDLSHLLSLDLGSEEVAKVAKNEDRPYKHGRQM